MLPFHRLMSWRGLRYSYEDDGGIIEDLDPFGWGATCLVLSQRPRKARGESCRSVELANKKAQKSVAVIRSLTPSVVSEGNAAANSLWLAPACAVRLLVAWPSPFDPQRWR